MLPYQLIAGGSFTADATLQKGVVLTDLPDLFVLRNRSSWGNDLAVTAAESSWRRGMASGAALTVDQAVTTGAMSTNVITSGGFTFIDTSHPPVFAPLITSGTNIDRTTFVVTMASTANISVGDWVRVTQSTSMLQIAGYLAQVTAVTPNTSITLGYLVSAGPFAANATAGFIQKVIVNRMYPRLAFITSITQAAQAVISFSGQNDFTPGEIISLRVSSAFGMKEINNKSVRVLSVVSTSSASSVTVDLNTSGYTAFAFPTSAVAALGVSPAVAVPSSSGVVPDAGSATNAQSPPGTNLRDAFDNRNRYVAQLGSSVVTTSGAIYDWVAYKFDKYTAE